MKHIFTAFALLLAASCGQPKSDREKRGVYIENLNATPIELFKEYTECEGPNAHSDSPYYRLIQFLNGRAFNRELNMEGSISGRELRSSGNIAQTYYGGAMRLEERVQNGRLIGAEFLVTEAPQTMSVCPGVKSYRRYSYENASLSANYAINKTISALREANFQASAPVRVFISPFTIRRLIRETRDRIYKEDYRITDNAFYFPHMGAVIFVPQSEESREGESFGNVPLWEVPMVASHEYGHHVFHSIMKSASGELRRTYDTCFKASQDEGEGARSFSRVGVSSVLGLLNEGFADLVAFYTLDREERGLKGVNCMETNREIDSPIFANNDQKLFHARAMSAFLNPGTGSGGGCYVPAYQNIHTMGAIFANVSDRLMSSFRLDKKAKLEVILNWLRALNENHRGFSRLGPEAYLAKSFSLLAAATVAKAGGSPGVRECQMIKYLAPASESNQRDMRALGCE